MKKKKSNVVATYLYYKQNTPTEFCKLKILFLQTGSNYVAFSCTLRKFPNFRKVLWDKSKDVIGNEVKDPEDSGLKNFFWILHFVPNEPLWLFKHVTICNTYNYNELMCKRKSSDDWQSSDD